MDADETAIAIGLGGNLGGEVAVVARLRAAVAALAGWPEVRGAVSSSLYRSAAVGPIAQPTFVNAAVRLRWGQPASAIDGVALLARLLHLEADLGRVRNGERWGPRAIDLDLWLIGERRIEAPGPPALSVPHPRMSERGFVLAPLAELVGADAVLPGGTQTIGALLAAPAVIGQALARLDYALS